MVHKAERSRLSNMAVMHSRKILKKSSDNFIKTYSTFIKSKNIFECSDEDFSQFYNSVNGFFRTKINHLKSDFKYADVGQLLTERRWRQHMNELKNARKSNKEFKLKHIIHDMQNN